MDPYRRNTLKRKSTPAATVASESGSGSFANSQSEDSSSSKLRKHLSRAESSSQQYDLPRISSGSSLASQQSAPPVQPNTSSAASKDAERASLSVSSADARPRKRRPATSVKDERRATWFGFPSACVDEQEEDERCEQMEKPRTEETPAQARAEDLPIPELSSAPPTTASATQDQGWLSDLSLSRETSQSAEAQPAIQVADSSVEPAQVIAPSSEAGLADAKTTEHLQAPAMSNIASNRSWISWPLAGYWSSPIDYQPSPTSSASQAEPSPTATSSQNDQPLPEVVPSSSNPSPTQIEKSVETESRSSWFNTIYRLTEGPAATVTPVAYGLGISESAKDDTVAASAPPTKASPVLEAPPQHEVSANGHQSDRRSSWFPSFFGSAEPEPSVPSNTLEKGPPQSTTPIPNTSSAPSSRASSIASSAKIAPMAPKAQHKSNLSAQNNSSQTSIEQPKEDHSAPLTSSVSLIKATATTKKGKPHVPNLVLPSFSDTFSRPPRSVVPPRKGKSVRSKVGSYIFGSGQPVEAIAEHASGLPRSLEVLRRPSRASEMKRILIIGVHGWFPSALIQSVFGPPTGTSSKFANMQAEAIREYFVKHGLSIKDTSLTICPLEGEGKIQHRVQKLFDAFTSSPHWVKAIREADAIFISTHSQGSIVSTHLVNKLMEEFHLPGSKFLLLCLASISAGPFFHLNNNKLLQPYFSYLENSAAKELFDFQQPDSKPAREHAEQLDAALAAGVKCCFVGGLDDQLVPLYSSTLSSFSHPGLLRSVFIDGNVFEAVDFLSNLIILTLRIRNAGIGDHSLIAQISESLAGALNGVGHSTIYEEPSVYALAVRYFFEVEPVSTGIAMQVDDTQRRSTNAVYLTWAFKSMIDDPDVKRLFQSELEELRVQYEEWKPVSKASRDIKHRLEPFKLFPLPKRAEIISDPIVAQSKL